MHFRSTAVISCLIPAFVASSKYEEFAVFDFEEIDDEFDMFAHHDWEAGLPPFMDGELAKTSTDWFRLEPSHASIPVEEILEPGNASTTSTTMIISESFVQEIDRGLESSRKRRASELTQYLEQLSETPRVDLANGVEHIRKHQKSSIAITELRKMIRPILELAVIPVWFYTLIHDSFTRGLAMTLFLNDELAESLVRDATEGQKDLRNPKIFGQKWIYDLHFIQRVIDVWVQYCFVPMVTLSGASQEERCKFKRRQNIGTGQIEEVWTLAGTGLREFLLKAVDEVKSLASL